MILLITTMSCIIQFGTAEMIKKEKSTMMTSLKQIIDTYNSRGFKVKHILTICNLNASGRVSNTRA